MTHTKTTRQEPHELHPHKTKMLKKPFRKTSSYDKHRLQERSPQICKTRSFVTWSYCVRESPSPRWIRNDLCRFRNLLECHKVLSCETRAADVSTKELLLHYGLHSELLWATWLFREWWIWIAGEGSSGFRFDCVVSVNSLWLDINSRFCWSNI